MKSFIRWLFINRAIGIPLRDGWKARTYQGEAMELFRDDYHIGFEIHTKGWLLPSTILLRLSENKFVWQPPHEEEVIDENLRAYLIALMREAVEFEKQKFILE